MNRHPYKHDALLEEIRQRPRNDCKMTDEFSVVTRQPEKAPLLLDIGELRPELDRVDLSRVSSHSRLADNMAKV